MKLYLFSGLGADTRLFKNMPSLEGCEVVPVEWINPESSRTLADYAALLAEQYHFEPPFALGGVSIGGMIVQELSRMVHPEKLILISTISSRNELPGLLKFAATFRLGNLAYKPALQVLATLGDKFTIKSKEGRALFFDMIKKSDADFLRFGARAILKWQPPPLVVPSIRIHGSDDKVFSISKIGQCHVIKGGGHFMMFERAEEISEVIRDFMED